MVRKKNKSTSARHSDAQNGNGQAASTERTPLLKPDAAATGPTPEQETSTTSSIPQAQASSRTHQDEEEEEEITIIVEEMSPARLWTIMASAWIGVLLGATDSTIIATLSGPIASEFKSLSLVSWLASAYFISNAAFQPISGRLTDIFGRGPGLVFSNIFFATGNLICGLAKDEKAMIAGRIVAGMGGGGLMSISTFLGSDLFPLRRRGVVQGIGNMCYGTGAMLGGVFGGLINDHTKMGWRLAFLIQVPPVIVSGIIAAVLVRVPPKQSDKSKLSRIDFIGVFLTISSLVLLLLGLNSGGNQVPWTHPLPLTTIPLSIVTFSGFIWWESRARQPIIPVKLLADRTILAACSCNFLCTMVTMTGLFYAPIYLQARGSTATNAGLQILPSPIGVSIGSIASGFFMKKTGKYWIAGVTAVAGLITGVVLFTIQDQRTPLWMASISFFFVGSGYGAMLTITLLACIAAVDHSQQAVVTSATYLARSLGSSIGVTVGGVVYQNILKARLWERFGDLPGGAEEIRRIRDDLNELKHLPQGWYDGVMQSFIDAFRGVWITCLCLAVVAFVCISLMREHKLHSTLSRQSD